MLAVALAPAQSGHAQTLFVAANNDLFQISSSGTVSSFASGLKDTQALTFDSKGDLFEDNYGDGKIYEFTSTGGVLSSTPTLFASLRKVGGLTFNSSGDLFASTPNSIVEYTNTGGVLSSTPTVFATGLTSPGALAFNSSGNLFVSDTDGSIDEFTPHAVESTFANVGYQSFGMAFQSAAVPEASTLIGLGGLVLGGNLLSLRRRR